MNEPTKAPIDPLDIPAGQLEEPSFPVLREGVKRMIIRGFEKKTFEGKDGTPIDALSIKLQTTADDRSTEDQVLHAGFAFNTVIFLSPNENNTAQQIAQQAAMPIKAALGANTKVTVRQCLDNPALILDKIVDAKIGIRKDKSGQYSDSNVVKVWIVPS
jgi:hypothetical protein